MNSLPPFAPSVNEKAVPIYVGSRIVGQVKGDTFYKNIRGSRHMLRKPQAIAFDISTLEDALDAGASKVEVTDLDDGKVYIAHIVDILRDGKRFNRGYGAQIYYLLSRWRHPDAPEQMTLFTQESGEARQSLATETGLPKTNTLTRKRKGVTP